MTSPGLCAPLQWPSTHNLPVTFVMDCSTLAARSDVIRQRYVVGACFQQSHLLGWIVYLFGRFRAGSSFVEILNPRAHVSEPKQLNRSVNLAHVNIGQTGHKSKT